MNDIFISYSREDADRRKVIVNALENLGFSVWMDYQIPTGQVYDEVILSELMSVKCVIVLWTKESVVSGWVKAEAQVGAERGILFQILLDDVDIPIGFGRCQSRNLVDWDGSRDDSAFMDLIKSINNFITLSSSENTF